MSKIIRYFPNSDLRCGHRGLGLVAKKAGHDPNELGAGEYLIFVNSKKNMLKMFASGARMVAHLKVDGRLDLNAIKLIPKYFDGTEIDYSKALAETITKSLN